MVDMLFENGPFAGKVIKNHPAAEQRKLFVTSTKSDDMYYLSRILYFSLANQSGKGYTQVPKTAVYRHVPLAEVTPCS